MRLLQFVRVDGRCGVGIVDGPFVLALSNVDNTYDLAWQAISGELRLTDLVAGLVSKECFSYDELVERRAVLVPLNHPDPGHMLISGTGLTHLGSDRTRDHLRRAVRGEQESSLSDTLQLFKWGLEGGKPAGEKPGIAPEWHYKGTGHSIVHPYRDFPIPTFSKDASEEPEIGGLYIIGPDRMPYRIGFALANELSDHVTERKNSGYVSHSKLIGSSFGPELLLDELPKHVIGMSCISRNGRKRWEKPFFTGEDNMSHSIDNIEFHHFKYNQFLVPGDVHVHYFGTSTLSFAEGIKVDAACRFEISAAPFGRPLVNGICRVDNSFQYRGVKTI